jgi:hypothetical protein|tara:strand:+ start:769 stop:1065 length:297 start_codon:yes stop_codon:yes gene_type:complete
LWYNSSQLFGAKQIKLMEIIMGLNNSNPRPIRTFITLNEAKKCVRKQGFNYKGHENYKEYKIFYYSKGKKNMIITSEPHQFLYRDSMDIGTKWYVFNW